MKTLFILFATCFAGIVNYSSNEASLNLQDCHSELTVEKNRSFKSADQDGATFFLVLENKSSMTAVYDLSTKNISAQCKNNNNTLNATGPNVEMNIALQQVDSDQPTNSKISLDSGKSFRFKVKVTVPAGTPFNKWSCIEVKAIPESCPSNAVKTILSVYVPNPSEG